MGHPNSQPEADGLRQHTPTPWFVVKNDGNELCIGTSEDDPWFIAEMSLGCEGDEAKVDPAAANAAFIVEAVNSHATLQARVDDRDRTIDLLEANARVQAKLLADTGRRVEELTKALEKVRSYNVDIAAERINYRPHDHIQVIDEALALPLEQSGSGK